jgi:hypothetical protein
MVIVLVSTEAKEQVQQVGDLGQTEDHRHPFLPKVTPA